MDYETAAQNALKQMLACSSNPAAVHDGRDLVLEALDDPEARKSIAQHVTAGLNANGDDAELGRIVRDRVLAYARSCPRFEDLVNDELVEASRGRIRSAA